MKRNTQNKGITLVALVVTIVVLLILAGITIVYVFGDNGIFKLAQEAKNKTEEGKIQEQEAFNDLQNVIEKAVNESGSSSGNKIRKEGRAVQKFFLEDNGGDVPFWNAEPVGFEDEQIELQVNIANMEICTMISLKENLSPYFIRMKALTPANVELDWRTNTEDSWNEANDGYWYYREALEGGGSTTELTYKINILDEEIEEFSMPVIVEYTPAQYDEDGNPFANWEL